MSLLDAIAALRRRWLVVGCCLLATLAAVAGLTRIPGVYHVEAEVILLPPSKHSIVPRNPYNSTTESLISTAGVVAKSLAGESAGGKSVSDAVTLVDEGIYEGYAVRLPNRGGQWAFNFDRAVLNVQAAGSTPTEAQAWMAEALTKIDAKLRQLQLDRGVPAKYLIKTQVNPPIRNVRYSNGNRTRALGVGLMLGLGLSVAVGLAVDRRVAGRRRETPDTAPLVTIR